jgi:hypothetical protein
MIKTSPRTSLNASKNRTYSIATIKLYKKYYDRHIKSDPIVMLKMAEIEEQDILDFNTRMSIKNFNMGDLWAALEPIKAFYCLSVWHLRASKCKEQIING